MNKKDMLFRFIKSIQNKKLLTDFIKNIFNYDNFYDYSYLFRMNKENDRVVIDIYDNISDNRFNRYIFIFKDTSFDIKVREENNVFVTYICVKNVINSNNKLLKLAYLFKLDNNEMIAYSKTFLNYEFVVILENMLNKLICQR